MRNLKKNLIDGVVMIRYLFIWGDKVTSRSKVLLDHRQHLISTNKHNFFKLLNKIFNYLKIPNFNI
jgi:hypothetical protein